MGESFKGRGVGYINIGRGREKEMKRAQMVPILEIGLTDKPQEVEVRL